MQSRLPVYLIHWNAGDTAVKTIRSLFDGKGAEIDLTVIDNASDPAALAPISEEFSGQAEIVRLDRNTGYAGAANVALDLERSRRASPRLFAVCAHEVLVEEDCLVRIIAAADRHPEYGVLGPVFLGEHGGVSSSGGLWSGWRGASHRKETPSKTREVQEADWLHGALLVVRGECADGVGGFDDRLFSYFEDVDFCLRAGDSGWKVGVVSGARAHEWLHTLPSEPRVFLIVRNSLLVSRRRSPWIVFFLRCLLSYMGCLRAFGGSLMPTRDASRRRLSRAFARGQFRGATAALMGRGGPLRV